MLCGRSETASRQLAAVREAASARAPALIVCEPGLEPGRVAEMLHGGGASSPFVGIDCTGVPALAMHDQLFGCGETAAAGRHGLETVRRNAALIAAGAGTLLLRNVVELPMSVQRRLARILRDAEMHVADTRSIVPLSARLVATAGPEIDADVGAGRMRADLYRRLAGHRILLAPLRDRPEDMPDVVRALAEEIGASQGVAARPFTPAALTALGSLPWTRNVDELRELLKRLHEEAPGVPARQEDVLRQMAFGYASPTASRFDRLRDARQRFEREYIAAVLARHQWRMADAARTLGIERANLYRKIRQLGLSRRPGGNAGAQ